ncbi:MAG: RNase adapter RapZ [Coriobacteriales bacterium]|nr:RNase adapter RapZ [Coriobacteriales bacterium]
MAEATAEERMREAAKRHRDADVVIITGLSGSGRTQAMHVFEDMGYFCIDNLPTGLILQIANAVGLGSGAGRHLAVTCDLRSQDLFGDLTHTLAELSEHDLLYKVIFLDASDEVLIRRYSENRRRHPIANEGEILSDAIARERKGLEPTRRLADLVIDTSKMLASELRTLIRSEFAELSDQQLMEVHVFSFGFKHGMPVEADLLIDVRFLPNPFWDPQMRLLTGNDPIVRDFVIEHAVTQEFLVAWKNLLDVVVPGYIAEGKTRVSIAIGCTGGQHRSVAIANATADYLNAMEYRVVASHRDLALANVRND